jgi:hypothetical protein
MHQLAPDGAEESVRQATVSDASVPVVFVPVLSRSWT